MITGKIPASRHNPGRQGAAEALIPPGEPNGPTPGPGTAAGCIKPIVIALLIVLYSAGLVLAAVVLGWIILTFASLFGWVGAWTWSQQLATGALAVFVIGSLRSLRK